MTAENSTKNSPPSPSSLPVKTCGDSLNANRNHREGEAPAEPLQSGLHVGGSARREPRPPHCRDCGSRYWRIVLLLLFAMAAPVRADVPPPPAAEFREPDGPDDPVQTLTLTVYLLIAVTVGSVSLMLVLML